MLNVALRLQRITYLKTVYVKKFGEIDIIIYSRKNPKKSEKIRKSSKKSQKSKNSKEIEKIRCGFEIPKIPSPWFPPWLWVIVCMYENLFLSRENFIQFFSLSDYICFVKPSENYRQTGRERKRKAKEERGERREREMNTYAYIHVYVYAWMCLDDSDNCQNALT